MADITQNIEINSIDLAVTVDTNQLSFTPDGINLNLYPGSTITNPGGSTSQIQYNGGNVFAGTSNLTYSGGITTISNVVVTTSANLGSVSNVKITGGTNGYVLQTDGAGNLTWTAQTGGGNGNGTPGGSNTQVQFNDAGIFGGNIGFTFNKTTGILTSPFYSGNAAGLSNITGANVTGNVANANLATFATTANSVAGANVSGSVANATYANNAGNANTANLATFATTANAVAGANVSGFVANANFANVSGYTTNATYATTAGTALSVSYGTFIPIGAGANAGNLYGIAIGANANSRGNSISIGKFAGQSPIGDIPGNSCIVINATGSNLTWQGTDGALFIAPLISSTYYGNSGQELLWYNTTTKEVRSSANLGSYLGPLSGNLTTAAQPNITSVGTLSNLNVSGNILANNFTVNSAFSATLLTGTLTTNAQPNVTSLGTLTGLNVNATVTATTFTSNIATGTAPMIVTSTTQIANMNVATSGAVANGNSNVYIGTANGNVTVAAVGNTTLTITGTGINVAGYANISGVITGNGNGLSSIVGANVTGTVGNATSATNASAVLSNVETTGTYYPTFISSTANGNYAMVSNTAFTANLANGYLIATGFSGNFSGNGSGLTGVSATVANGTSNISIPAANGNINFVSGGNTSFIVTNTGANVGGSLRVDAGLGYSNVSSADVVQTTSRNNSVTANVYQGQIELAQISVTANTSNLFTVTNSLVTSYDIILLNQSAGNTTSYIFQVSRVGSGSFQVFIRNLFSVANDTVRLNFAVFKRDPI